MKRNCQQTASWLPSLAPRKFLWPWNIWGSALGHLAGFDLEAKCCTCHDKWLSWWILLTHEMSSTLRGATGVALQLTKYCRCHKTGTLMIDTRHIWNVQYIARRHGNHPPTSPNIAPVTKFWIQDLSEKSDNCFSFLFYSSLLFYTLLLSTPTILNSTVLFSTILYSALFFPTLLYSTLLYSTLLYSTLLY